MRKSIQDRFEERFIKSDGCWEWIAYKDGGGYGIIKIDGKKQKAHRVAYRLYVGEIPDGMCVCHRCDNPGCVNPGHLFLGTMADNMRDCENKGRRVHPSGEKNGRAKLTEAQVVEIRVRYSEGDTQSELAKEFGVTQTAISHIVYGRNWPKLGCGLTSKK